MFSTITIVTTTPFIFDIWDIEMLSDNRVHFRNGNKKITFGDTVNGNALTFRVIYTSNFQSLRLNFSKPQNKENKLSYWNFVMH